MTNKKTKKAETQTTIVVDGLISIEVHIDAPGEKSPEKLEEIKTMVIDRLKQALSDMPGVVSTVEPFCEEYPGNFSVDYDD
jgi:divalent metal cation (Fe/Co/Zn/Cd) transporter